MVYPTPGSVMPQPGRVNTTRDDGPTDDQLLKRIAHHKDRQAFEILFTRHHKHAYNLAFRLTSNPELAEEAVQDALLDIWHGTGRFREGRARAWLFGVVARKCFQNKRHKREQKTHTGDLEPLAPILADPVSKRIEHAELVGALRSQLAKLSNAEQQLLTLYFAGELSQDEISKLLRIPQRTVSSKITRLIDFLGLQLRQAGLAGGLTVSAEDLIKEATALDNEMGPAATERIWEAIRRGIEEDGDREAGPVEKRSITRVGAVFMLAAICGVAVLAGHQARDSHTPPPASSSPRLRTTVASSPLPLEWTFEKGLPAAFEPMHGDFEIWPATALHPAELACTPHGHSLFVLPSRFSKQPLLVKARGRLMHAPHWTIGVVQVRDRRVLPRRLWLERSTPTDPSVDVQIYIFEKRIVHFLKDQVVILAEYDSPLSNQKLALDAQGVCLQMVSMEAIRAEDVPAAAHASAETIFAGKAFKTMVRQEERTGLWQAPKGSGQEWDFRKECTLDLSARGSDFRWQERTREGHGALMNAEPNALRVLPLPCKISAKPTIVTVRARLIKGQWSMAMGIVYKNYPKRAPQKMFGKLDDKGPFTAQWLLFREYVGLSIDGKLKYIGRYPRPVPGEGVGLGLKNGQVEHLSVQEFPVNAIPAGMKETLEQIAVWEAQIAKEQ